MADPQRVEPVKLFVAILWGASADLAETERRLVAEWGACDVVGADRDFDVTDYYEPEMGAGLRRRLVAFDRLSGPESLASAKLRCNALERELSSADGGRTVNLDVGYLDHNKVVLASVRSAGQKIYVGQGVYADLVGRFARGRYQPFEWTFPDFRDGRYDVELLAMRRLYLGQRRQWQLAVQPPDGS